jgi:excisionase family DNA binding protein
MWRDQKKIEWYLPIAEVADQLGCHPREVCELAEKGILSLLRMPGNRIKISEESVRRVQRQLNQETWRKIFC